MSAPTLRRTAPLVICLLALLLLTIRRWQQIGPYVTGNDPGNWLALGRGLTGGRGPGGGGVYAPLIPLAAHLLSGPFGAMTAAKLLGAGSWLLLAGIAFRVMCVAVDRWIAAGAALLLAQSNTLMEPVAFGGYPQNVALAAVLVAGWQLAQGLRCLDGRSEPIWKAAAWSVPAMAVAALAQPAYFVVACLALVAIWLCWLIGRPPRVTRWRGTLLLALPLAAGVLVFMPTFLAMLASGYSPPINAGAGSLSSVIAYGISDAPWIWIPMIALAVGFGIFGPMPPLAGVDLLARGLLLTSMLLLVTAEARLLVVVVLGVVLTLALALEWLRRLVKSPRAGLVTTGAALVCALALVPAADRRAVDLFRYYAVVDGALLRTASWLQSNDHGATVAVAESARGWPVGWWFEGLTSAPIRVGSDLQWLAFPGERRDAQLAGELFDDNALPEQVRAEARGHGVRYLVGSTAAWKSWASLVDENGPGRLVFSAGDYRIVDLGPPTASSGY